MDMGFYRIPFYKKDDDEQSLIFFMKMQIIKVVDIKTFLFDSQLYVQLQYN